MTQGKDPASNRRVQEAKAKKDKYERAIRQLEKHVRKISDGTFQLDIQNAQEAGVDPTAFADLKRAMEEGNKRIKAGEVQADHVQKTTDTP
jgi:predicted  nucleic acid-binding Zn-ribbon protein